MKQFGDNEKGKHSDLLNNKKNEYPLTYDLKVITDTAIPKKERRQSIENILSKLDIPSLKWKTKNSNKANFIGHSIKVTIKDQQQSDRLYNDLKSIKGIIFTL